MNSTFERAKIVGFCTAAACFYGVVHDQITARICLEYFTFLHPPILESNSPTLIGLIWGILGTIGVGLVLGCVLAWVLCPAACNVVDVAAMWPRLRRGIAWLLVVMALCSLCAGLAGHWLVQSQILALPSQWAEEISMERHARLMAVWFAHGASYLVGAVGALWLIFWLARHTRGSRPVALLPQGGWAWARLLGVSIMSAGLLLWRYW